MTTSRSDLLAFQMPGSVQLFAVGLCDALKIRRWFWIDRAKNERMSPAERFALLCLRERLQTRYHMEITLVSDIFRVCHSRFHSQFYRQAHALFGLYPDLRKAVVYLDGLQAGRFIVDRWDVPIRRVCGQ